MNSTQTNKNVFHNPALKQKRWWGGILIFSGALIVFVGLSYALLNVFGELFLAFLGICLSYVGVRILNRGRRHFVPVGLTELEKDPRPPVLYLRPFTQDGSSILMRAGAINRGMAEKAFWRQASTFFRFYDTYEQIFALCFRKIGPVAAIGEPTEGLPELGAIRIYVGIDGDWQEMVSNLANKASYVILQIGKSDGLMWEVQHIIENVRPEQLILCLPNQKFKITRLGGFKKREKERQKIYQIFRDKTQDYFPVPLPEEIGGAMFIYFAPNWEAQPTHYQSEMVISFKRQKPSFTDPKLEALNWLNSVLY